MRGLGSDGHGVGVNVHEVLENAGVIGLWEYRLADCRVYADSAMARAYGIDEQVAHRGASPELYRAAIHPEDVERAVATLNAAIASQSEYRTRYRIRGSIAGWLLVEVHAQPVMVLDMVVAMAGISRRALDGASFSDDPIDELASIAIRAYELAGDIEDNNVSYFAELLLFEVGKALARSGRAKSLLS